MITINTQDDPDQPQRSERGKLHMAHPFGQQDDVFVEEALQYIWSNCHYCLSVDDVARYVNLTRRTLDRHFSDALGISVLNVITECRMQRARSLLTTTDLQIKRVAQLAGFSSPERMRVTFITHEGVPPKQFRANSK